MSSADRSKLYSKLYRRGDRIRFIGHTARCGQDCANLPRGSMDPWALRVGKMGICTEDQTTKKSHVHVEFDDKDWCMTYASHIERVR